MNVVKLIGITFFLTYTLSGYKDRESKTETEPTIANNTNSNVDSVLQYEQYGDVRIEGSVFLFPHTGKTEDDFIKYSSFGINKNIEGLLNKDKLTDRVLLLEDKDYATRPPILLVLTQQQDHTYKLVGKKENFVDIQDVRIVDHTLIIDKVVVDKQNESYFGVHRAIFVLDNDTLYLQRLDVSYFDADAQFGMEYLPKQHKVREAVTNTLDYPATTKVDSFNYVTTIPKGFEDINTDSIIESIMSKSKLEF